MNSYKFDQINGIESVSFGALSSFSFDIQSVSLWKSKSSLLCWSCLWWSHHQNRYFFFFYRKFYSFQKSNRFKLTHFQFHELKGLFAPNCDRFPWLFTCQILRRFGKLPTTTTTTTTTAGKIILKKRKHYLNSFAMIFFNFNSLNINNSRPFNNYCHNR